MKEIKQQGDMMKNMKICTSICTMIFLSVVALADLESECLESGSMHACYMLGKAYRDGDGVPKDPQSANIYLELACKGKVEEACLLLEKASIQQVKPMAPAAMKVPRNLSGVQDSFDTETNRNRHVPNISKVVKKPEYELATIHERALRPMVVYSDHRTYHLGDEQIRGRSWRGLYGICYAINFNSEGYRQKYYLSLQKFGVESAMLYMNEKKIGYLPRQYSRNRRKRPNFWSRQERIAIPNAYIVQGNNMLEICASPVAHPEFPGDLDDMQIKNIQLIRE